MRRPVPPCLPARRATTRNFPHLLTPYRYEKTTLTSLRHAAGRHGCFGTARRNHTERRVALPFGRCLVFCTPDDRRQQMAGCERAPRLGHHLVLQPRQRHACGRQNGRSLLCQHRLVLPPLRRALLCRGAPRRTTLRRRHEPPHCVRQRRESRQLGVWIQRFHARHHALRQGHRQRAGRAPLQREGAVALVPGGPGSTATSICWSPTAPTYPRGACR